MYVPSLIYVCIYIHVCICVHAYTLYAYRHMDIHARVCVDTRFSCIWMYRYTRMLGRVHTLIHRRVHSLYMHVCIYIGLCVYAHMQMNICILKSVDIYVFSSAGRCPPHAHVMRGKARSML